MIHLPNEILLSVSSFLPHRDVVALHHTSTILYNLLAPIVWSTTVITGHAKSCDCKTCFATYDPFAQSWYTTWELSFTRSTSDQQFSSEFIESKEFARTLTTGRIRDDPRSKEGLLYPPYQNTFSRQLRYVKKAVFLHTFFQDHWDGTGRGVETVERFLRQFTGVETIVIILGTQGRFDRALLAPNRTREQLVLLLHPCLRYDLWLQPFLNVFQSTGKTSFELHLESSVNEIFPGRRRRNDCLHAFFKLFGAGYRITALSLAPVWMEREVDLKGNCEPDERVSLLPEILKEAVRLRGLRRLCLRLSQETESLAHEIFDDPLSMNGLETLRLYHIPRSLLHLPSTLRNLSVFQIHAGDTYINLTFPASSNTLSFVAIPDPSKRAFLTPCTSDSFAYSPSTLRTLPPTLTSLGLWSPTSNFPQNFSTWTSLRILQLEKILFPVSDLIAALPALLALRLLHITIDERPQQEFKISKELLTTALLNHPERSVVVAWSAAIYKAVQMRCEVGEDAPDDIAKWYLEVGWEGEGREVAEEMLENGGVEVRRREAWGVVIRAGGLLGREAARVWSCRMAGRVGSGMRCVARALEVGDGGRLVLV